MRPDISKATVDISAPREQGSVMSGIRINPYIVQLYETSGDMLLVNKWFGDQIWNDFMYLLAIPMKVKLLETAKELENDEVKQAQVQEKFRNINTESSIRI